MLSNNLTPLQVYNYFLINLKKDCEVELGFYLQKADRSKCPRHKKFNSLYIKYFQKYFGESKGPVIFCNLGEGIYDFMYTYNGGQIAYEMYLIISRAIIIKVKAGIACTCFNFDFYGPAGDQTASKGIYSCRSYVFL